MTIAKPRQQYILEELWLRGTLKQLKPVKITKYSKHIFYYLNDRMYIRYNPISKYLWISEDMWDSLWLKFHMPYLMRYEFIEGCVARYYGWKDVIIRKLSYGVRNQWENYVNREIIKNEK